ncbi:MAG TPA: polysaccharide biosynthesis/export family protein [Bryobacteraceae bacterium]
MGPGDVIAIHALHVPEIAREPMKLAEDGSIDLPMIGHIKAAGLTPVQLSAEIRNRLDNFVKQPEVSVDVLEVKSRPVSVIGALKSPGVYQLSSTRHLLEILAAAGGVEETAGSVIHVSRPRESGPIPVPGATETADSYLARISLPDLVEGRCPESNIVILPHDVITVPRAKLVYVVGEVHKAGGFVLKERENISVLQAISLAEGLTVTAGSKNARIIRPSEDGSARAELPVNVKNILAGKAEDLALHPNDILFIPNSAAKNATLRGVETAIQVGTGLVIWHR